MTMAASLEAIPLAPHRRVVAGVLDEARANPLIIGVLLIGSLGRGNAVPGSDIDLLLLLPDDQGQTRIFPNQERAGLLIEFHYRDVAAALAQLEDAPG